jgi:hypothetical protein
MTKMYYVRLSIMLMTIKMLQGGVFKSWPFFYKNPINSPNPRTKEKKGLITDYKTYGIITLKKHVNVNHGIIAKKFKGNE